MAPIFRPTLLFTEGRDCDLSAVVLHSYPSSIANLNAEMDACPRRPRPTAPRKCHDSFHFGISGCLFNQYVEIADTAWGFYFIPTPLCPEPPCPIVQTCDGIGADQYNPDWETGDPATPDVTDGADLTANCSVIHVAIATGILNNDLCPTLTPHAYDCLVRSLCYIFEEAGLTPEAGTTLLTHIGELANLDLVQLAEDIQACIDAPPAPLPPCDCIPTVLVADTTSINMTAAAGPTISGTVIISPNAGNQLTSIANGLFVAADTEVPITVVDTNSINLTASGTDNHTLQADLIVSPDVGNRTSVLANGVFTPSELGDINTCDGPYVDQTIVTTEAWLDSVPSATPARIWTSPSEEDCPTRLEGVDYDELLPEVTVVLGTNPADDITPVWGRVARPPLESRTFTDANATISANVDDVFIYTGVPAHDVTLNPPTTSIRTDIWVKNRSANVLTITSGSGAIDGQTQITLAGTIPAGYPFGNDGGESVHLFWDGTDWFVL